MATRRRNTQPQTFTDAAQSRTAALLDDLLARAKLDGVDRALNTVWQAEKTAKRTGDGFVQWRRLRLTQVAAAWVLSCVFVRTLEDRGLVARVRIASVDGSAADSEQQFYGLFPFLGAADYLLAVFRELQRFPGLQDVFDRRHNPVWQLSPSQEGARQLLEFFRDREGERLRWSFAAGDPAETRFLGDLYQDLNIEAQKRYALLQTPDFVEELILEETLDPAIERFGLSETKVLDPACGSGHFLLGSFRRLLHAWEIEAPGLEAKARVERALSQVYGADINPYAIAIARFRLVLAATVAAGIGRLDAEAVPRWPLHLCTGNSLLLPFVQGDLFAERHSLPFGFDDPAAVTEVFGRHGEQAHYEAVVGNPPYVRERDATIRATLRDRYRSAYREFALAAPFTERFFQLAREEGYVGVINSNAWTKREFGRALIEQVLPEYSLNLVIDTSGAYIPGHGTPTLLLFGQRMNSTSDVVRTVQGKRGEPSTPSDPRLGLVWSAIRDHHCEIGYEDGFISVVDTPTATFAKHPWSLGGGGAAQLKGQIEDTTKTTLRQLVDSIGFVCITKQDDVFKQPAHVFRTAGVEEHLIRPFGIGEDIRDWMLAEGDYVLFPYDEDISPIELSDAHGALRFLWPYRRILETRAVFGGKDFKTAQRPWWEYGQIPRDRFKTPLSIAFAFVATHNHFVLDRGGKVFKQTAPVIKLKADATEEDHLALLGLLNSSVAWFWIRQVIYCKGEGGKAGGLEAEEWFRSWELDGTKIGRTPIPQGHGTVMGIAKLLDRESAALRVANSSESREESRRRCVALQEELDWVCYRLYALTADRSLEYGLAALPPIRLGERAFEIVLARRIAEGKETTTWFERHGSTPITEIPSHWPDSYREVVQRRIDLIESDRNIGLIERPEYKRRWNVEPWDQQVDRALRTFLLRRLESDHYWPAPDSSSLRPISLTSLADKATQDDEFGQVGARLQGSDHFDVEKLVAEIALPEAVPVMAACRYKPSGLEKRTQWEETWELQRREDRGEDVPEIAVPPKYKSSDFQKPDYWRLRGKLDVPKETFLLYPHCGTGTDIMLGWAGWDHLHQARALANLYLQRKDEDGWTTEQLKPILVALAEVTPWVLQWHNDPDPSLGGQRPGETIEAFLAEELRRHGLTADDLSAWRPGETRRGRRRGRTASQSRQRSSEAAPDQT